MTYRSERSHKRRAQRVRVQERVVVPIDPARGLRDPLDRPTPGLGRRAGTAALFLAIALVLEASLIATLMAVPSGTFDPGKQRRVQTEKVAVRIIDREPEPQEVLPALVVVEPDAPEPVVAPTRTIIKKSPKEIPQKREIEPPPPDPVDVSDAPPPEKPRRRVVGLNFSSTVKGSGGPSFAVGNTRMGQTSTVAEDKNNVEKLQGRAIDKAPATGANRGAAYIPGSAVRFQKPKRLEQAALSYPPTLKAQGIEGNVIVLIEIEPDGKVSKAKILKSSGHSEFDSAARKAALGQKFSPARRAGEPVAYTLKYTYRFRIKEA